MMYAMMSLVYGNIPEGTLRDSMSSLLCSGS